MERQSESLADKRGQANRIDAEIVELRKTSQARFKECKLSRLDVICSWFLYIKIL